MKVPGTRIAVAAADAARGEVGELLALGRARDELGLDEDEFALALQIGEVRAVACGPALWKVPRSEVDRWQRQGRGPDPDADSDAAADRGPDGLRERLRLVSSAGAAAMMGVGRQRFVLLARCGTFRPVRWYVNQYRAVVWLYLAREVTEFAARNPGLLKGPMPAELHEADGDGRDRRARGWRERRTEQLVRDAWDAWHEAAVWAALLGPDGVAEAVPDPVERAYLRVLRAGLPPGRAGRASLRTVRDVTTADHPEEISHALLALAEALSRARVLRPAPRPDTGAPEPAAARAARAAGDAEPGAGSAEAADAAGAGTPGEQAAVAVQAAPAPGGPAGPGRARGRLRGMLFGRRAVTAPPGRPRAQSSPTSVRRITARASSSEAARSTSAEMPQP